MRVRRGVALLIVLGIVMVITMVAFMYLSRSDSELAYGQNMLLRTQADLLAESALEHARGLILNPQETSGEYWTGATSQQIETGDFYYDVTVEPNLSFSGPSRWCNYDISCRAYRLSGDERTAQSNLKAMLRLNPCIAYWSDSLSDRQLSSAVTINGDVYCRGNVANYGLIEGDAFGPLTGTVIGQIETSDELTLQWPDVNVTGFTSEFIFVSVTSPLSSELLGPYVKCNSDLTIAGDVQIDGMLIVDGDLRISGNGNHILAEKAMPAMLVTGDLIIEQDAEVDIEGLAVIEGTVNINVGCEDVNVLGGLFAGDGIVESISDWAGNSHDAIIVSEPLWFPAGGQITGAAGFNGSSNKIEEYDASSYLNGLSAVTVSCWVKSDVTNQDRGIFYTKVPSGIDEELGFRYDEDGMFGGGVRGIKASIRTNFGYKQIESSSYVQTTDWQHLALVWETGNSLKLYINGVEDSLRYNSGIAVGTISGVDKFMLGCGGKGQYWDGLIDDVRIYSRALDAGEVIQVRDGVDGISNLIAHWKLDEDGQREVTITAAPTKTAIWCWSDSGERYKWAQAAAAFYKVIRRN